jgi:hypothetical protein
MSMISRALALVGLIGLTTLSACVTSPPPPPPTPAPVVVAPPPAGTGTVVVQPRAY